jgi:hypothetical protein
MRRNWKQKIEGNIAVFFLSTLLVGFFAGVGCYKAILEIAKLEVVSKIELEKLRNCIINPVIHLQSNLHGLSQINVEFSNPSPDIAILSLRHSSSPNYQKIFCSPVIKNRATWHSKDSEHLFLVRGPGANTTIEILVCNSPIVCESAAELKFEQLKKCQSVAIKTAWLGDKGIEETSNCKGDN